MFNARMRMTAFTDPFASIADPYALHRPRYPDALFAFLAGAAPDRTAAWDCATGNGQAAIGLAKYFGTVFATDASAEQLARAEACSGVDYKLAPAEDSGIPDHSVSVVTVAQAVHWFELPRFYREVRRVLKPNGVLAVWGYVLFRTGEKDIDERIDVLNYEILKPYFDARVLTLWDGYIDLPFPFQRLQTREWSIEVDWSLDDFMGLISSWSGLKAYRAATGLDPLPALRAKLEDSWGDGRRRLVAQMPTLIGRIA
jgi:ubiquinone/menaquinone biosynthesis C-methylase UbiE